MHNEFDLPATADTARDKVQHALVTARRQTGDALARGGNYLRERPAVSVGSAFALGLAVGALVVLATRPAPKKSFVGESRERLADLLGDFAGSLRDPWEKTYSSVADGASALSDSVAQVIEKVAAKKNSRWW